MSGKAMLVAGDRHYGTRGRDRVNGICDRISAT
jgi:hypothetical protein